jgi:hypothetical protein
MTRSNKMFMLQIYSFNLVVLLASAIFFYRAADLDNNSGVLWATLSVVVSVLVWFGLGWGVIGIIVSQVGLLVCIGIVRVVRK